MARPSNYSPELRARAVRMVAELTPDYPSQYAAITAVAKNLFSASGRCLQDHDSGSRARAGRRSPDAWARDRDGVADPAGFHVIQRKCAQLAYDRGRLHSLVADGSRHER